MTAIVGVLCNEGVVIGTDSSTTFVHGLAPTIEQATEKLVIIGDSVIIAGTGYVGHGQRFCEIVRTAWRDRRFQGDPFAVTAYLTRTAIENLASTHANLGRYAALVAFPCEQRPYLCEFQLADFQPELKTLNLWYVSMGSSQPITDPFLAFIRNVYWGGGPPSVYDAVFAITWTLDHAIEVNPGGVNGPVRIAVLERVRGRFHARLLAQEELEEHRQNIDAAKDVLRQQRAQQANPAGAAEIPPVPEPRQ